MFNAIPARYKLPLAAIALAFLGLGAYVANVVFAEPEAACCATEFDATPYETTPAP